MRLNRIFILSLILSIQALFFVGCGGGGLDKPEGPSGTISSTAATTFKSGIGGTAVTMSNPYNANMAGNMLGMMGSRRLTISKPARGSLDFNGCTPTQGGDSTDADGDSIPVNQTWAFACNISDASSNISVSGSVALQDLNDALVFPLGGIKATIDNVKAEGTFEGQNGSLTANGEFQLNLSGTSVTSNLSASIEYNLGSNTFEYGAWIDTNITAGSAETPSSSGTIAVSGFLKLKDAENDYVVQIASQGLKYGSCTRTSFLKDGWLSFTDGSNNVIKVTFDAACNSIWTYNDTAFTR